MDELFTERDRSLQHSCHRRALSNQNVLLGTVLSAPPNDLNSHTVSCWGICNSFSFKHLEHKIGIKLFSNIFYIGFHYDSIC